MANEKPSNKLASLLRGATEVAPNATHYFDYQVGHWVAGEYAGETTAETEYGEQRRILLRNPTGEGLILFGDEEKTHVELDGDDDAIVSVGLTGMGERLFESALAQRLALGDTIIYQVTNKGKDKVNGRGVVTQQGAWIVSLHRKPGGGRGRRIGPDDAAADDATDDDVPFDVPGEKRAARRGGGRGRRGRK